MSSNLALSQGKTGKKQGKTEHRSALFPPKKVLATIDGSDNSKRAADFAIKLAADYNAELVVWQVVPLPMMLVSGPAGLGAPINLEDYYSVAEEEAQKWMREIAAKAKAAGVKASTSIMRSTNSIVDSICRNAESEHVDLIVIGTRGLGGFKRLLMGSVSSGVVAHAHCSVLVVR